MKVKDLKKEVDKLIKEGYGDHEIFIAKDEEGNGFDYMYFGFTKCEGDNIGYYEEEGLDPNQVILLG